MNTTQTITDNVPLCVDLDGTLVKTDTLVEAFFALAKHRFSLVALIPFWLLKGKAYLKQQIAYYVELDVSVLPYHESFLDFLRAQHDTGRRLVLVTASNKKFARQVADHLGLFDEIVASDEKTNLSGGMKAERLRATYGNPGFDYAANARVDLKVWRHARRAILVNPQYRVKAAAGRLTQIERVFDDRQQTIRSYFRAMRLHQWLKNTLVFVPLLASHQASNLQLVLLATIGFLAYGLCASGLYILNDLLDLESDRHHPRKRHRPLAAGTISINGATLLIPVLLLVAFGTARFLPPPFLLALAIYYGLTFGYSLWLKRIMLLDVLVLAGLYTLRIIAGGAAVTVTPSFWLLAFSMFLFVSLAMIKRYSELLVLQYLNKTVVRDRDYRVVDLDSLMSLGAASGLMAVLVLALYINSGDVIRMYSRPELIWLLCPVLMYWIGRVWLLTRRGEMDDDPIIFAIRDPTSQLVGVIAVIILLLAI